MSGETEQNVSGWTTDTLRVSLNGQIAELRESMQRQVDDLRVMLDERYVTQVKAVDAAFLAQQTAMQAALAAAETAVDKALLAAKEAVNKAEVAADKRFEATNEFRGQLNDMVVTLLPRAEAMTRFSALDEKIESKTKALTDAVADMATRSNERASSVDRRLDDSAGQRRGASETHAEQKREQSTMIALASVVVALIIGVVTIILATR